MMMSAARGARSERARAPLARARRATPTRLKRLRVLELLLLVAEADVLAQLLELVLEEDERRRRLEHLHRLLHAAQLLKARR